MGDLHFVNGGICVTCVPVQQLYTTTVYVRYTLYVLVLTVL